MSSVYEERAIVFKAFCDPRRQRILALLRHGEKCACRLIDEMGMPQSSLSYHMKILCESGVVVGREDGKWTHYRISKEGSQRALEMLHEITMVEECMGEATNCDCSCSQEVSKK